MTAIARDRAPGNAGEVANAVRRIALTAAAALLFGSPAFAEKADRDKPIQLEADLVTVDDAKQIATFTGNVVLTQGSMVIRGNRLEVRQDNAGFRQGTTWGNLAYFRQKREGADEFIEGYAERIEYDGRTDKVQMFNRATMKRGEDQVHGNYISYDAVSELYQVSGGNTQAGGSPGDGRVRATIHPKPKTTSPAASPATLRPEGAVDAKRRELGAAR